MSVPNRVLRLRFGTDGQASIDQKLPFRMVKNEKVVLDVFVESLVPNSNPPSYVAVNITGWASKWVGKSKTSDADVSALWNVVGSIIGLASLGNLQFTIPKATMTFTGERIFSEILCMPDGATPQVRTLLSATIIAGALTV